MSIKHRTYFAFGLFALMFTPFVVSHAATVSACDAQYTSPKLPPSGFGAPYNLFTQAKELFIKPTGCSDSSVVLAVGNAAAQTQTYTTGYYWADKQWKPFTLLGSPANSWKSGSAFAIVPSTGSEIHVALYMCQNTSLGLKCGCRDGSCTANRWMYQTIKTEKSVLASGDEKEDRTPRDDRPDDKWVMGYYPSWDQERLDRSDIPWEYLTHIAFGIAAPRADGTLNLDFDMSDGEGEDLAKRVARDAERNDVKAMLMIGGGSGNWQVATNEQNVKTYARNLVEAMDDLGYDGIDLDWEPLGDIDLPNMVALAEELRRLEPDMLLSIAVPYKTINQATPSRLFGNHADLFDQINVMTYDMSGAWPGWESWHHSALYGAGSTHPTSIESSVKAYIDAGVPKNKIGIGAPFYGRCWQNVDGPNQIGGVTNGPMSYRLIRREYYDRDNLEWDSRARASYLSFDEPTGPDGCTFITYAEERDMKERAEYINDENLGGIIVWSVGQAHMDENSRTRRHPLLKALWNELF